MGVFNTIKFVQMIPNRSKSLLQSIRNQHLKLSMIWFTHRSCVEIFWDALGDLVPFLQIKKCEKHPWRNDTSIKQRKAN